MKHLVISIALILVAGAAAHAAEVQIFLTRENLHYSTDDGPHARLEIVRRSSQGAQTLVVPETEDSALESQARLIWDSRTSTLFVAWCRESAGASEIRIIRLDANGLWSKPLVIGAGPAKRAALQAIVTHAPSNVVGVEATLLHLVWWSIGAGDPLAEYALVAFEAGAHVSTDVTAVDALEDESVAAVTEIEDVGSPLHPPLAMSQQDTGVEIVYGATQTTTLKHSSVRPRIASQARMWRPGRIGGGRTPRAGLVSNSSAPVGSFLANGRTVLYSPGLQFRYVIYENGSWSAVRTVILDDKLSSDEFVAQLRKSVEEMDVVASAPPAPAAE